MHLEVLNKNQHQLLSLVSLFKREYYLVIKNINYSEEVTFCIENPPSEEEIKDFLTDVSISGL